MLFYNLLLLLFLNIQSSASHLKCIDEHDMYTSNINRVNNKNNNYYSNIKPRFYMRIYHDQDYNDECLIEIYEDDDKNKIISETNFLNNLIARHLINCNNHIDPFHIYIPLIENTNPRKCQDTTNQKVINILKKIKQLNVNDEFEIDGQKMKDPFNLCKEIDSCIIIHSKHIFIKNYPKILKQGIITTISSMIVMINMLEFFESNKKIPYLPVLAFLLPFLIDKPTYFYIESFFKKNNLKGFLYLFSKYFMAPILCIYLINNM